MAEFTTSDGVGNFNPDTGGQAATVQVIYFGGLGTVPDLDGRANGIPHHLFHTQSQQSTWGIYHGE